MKSFFVLLVCLFALAVAQENALTPRPEAGLIRKLSAVKSEYNAALRSLFTPVNDDNRRQAPLTCNADPSQRQLRTCQNCNLAGTFVNVSSSTEPFPVLSVGTNIGRLNVTVSLSTRFASDLTYKVTSQIRVTIDAQSAAVLNAIQAVECPTDVTPFDYTKDLVNQRVEVTGNLDTPVACNVVPCTASCTNPVAISQEYCGRVFNLDSDNIENWEDSEFYDDFLTIFAGNFCNTLDTDSYRLVTSFTQGTANNCNILYLNGDSDTGMTRQASAGGRLVAGFGLVLASLLFTLF